MNTEARNTNIFKQKDTDCIHNRGHDTSTITIILDSFSHLYSSFQILSPKTLEHPKLLFFNIRSKEYISIFYLLHSQDRQNPTPFLIFPAIIWPKLTLSFSLAIKIRSYVVTVDLLTTTIFNPAANMILKLKICLKSFRNFYLIYSKSQCLQSLL